jgi:hypothetical protein
MTFVSDEACLMMPGGVNFPIMVNETVILYSAVPDNEATNLQIGLSWKSFVVSYASHSWSWSQAKYPYVPYSSPFCVSGDIA